MARPVWTATERARERIMLYGPMGVGKTKAAIDIARRMAGTDNTMYVIDAENAWERMAPQELIGTEIFTTGEQEEGGGPLHIAHVRGWEQQSKALDYALTNARRNDWMVLDSASVLWDDILKSYIKKVHGDDLPEFLVQHRLEQVRANAKKREKGERETNTAGQDATLVEWNFINPLWHRTVTEPLTWAGCHVLVLAEAGELRSDGRDSKQIKTLFSDAGHKPRTQKGLGFAMSTVLFMDKTEVGDYKMLTVKDREDSRGDRAAFERDPWSDFVMDYLKGVAGWKMQRPT